MFLAGEEDYPDEGCWNNNEIKVSLIHREASETSSLSASLNTSGHIQCDRDTQEIHAKQPGMRLQHINEPDSIRLPCELLNAASCYFRRSL